MLEICDYIKMVLDEFAAKLRNAAVALVWDIMFQKLMQEEHWMVPEKHGQVFVPILLYICSFVCLRMTRNYFRCYFVIEMNESIQ